MALPHFPPCHCVQPWDGTKGRCRRRPGGEVAFPRSVRFSLRAFREVKARVPGRRHYRRGAKSGRAVPPAESAAGRERRAAPPAINRLPRTQRATAHPAARAFITRGPRVLGAQEDSGPGPCAGAGWGFARTPPSPTAQPRALRMGRPAGERRGEEGGRGGPALQQLFPACDSPVPAVPLGQSHKAQWGGKEHRVPLLGPWGPSWEIPASALPSPPPRSPSRGGGNASRAQTPPPPPPPQPPRRRACCCRGRGTRRVLSRVKKRREPSGGDPSRPPAAEERSQPGTMGAPPAQAGPTLPPSTCAPRPGPGL